MIFVHSSFRTGSTYIWSCLRKSPRTVAYYEVFNEGLSFFSRDQLTATIPDDWHSGHPPGAPYFLEFAPLLRAEGGIEGFDPAMSYACFIPPDGCGGRISEAEIGHIGRLIGHAEGRGRIPVLTATRSLGRVRGLKAAFPGLHILLYRNLFQQWCSVTDQTVRGNTFFLNTFLRIFELNQHDAQLRDLRQIFPIETASIEDTNTFYSFIFLHLYLYVHAAGAADILLDINRLQADKAYRREVENAISRHDVAIDFSGAKNSIAYSICRFGASRSFQDQLKVIGENIIDQSPDQAGRDLGIQLLADLIEEQARHEFHTTALRSVLLGPAGSLVKHDVLRQERDAALAGREAMQLQRDSAVAGRDQLRIERDAALNQRDAMQVERDTAEAARHQLRIDRDDALAQREAMRIERDGAIGERDAARVDRDTERNERERLRNERDAALAAIETLRAERDLANTERDGFRVQRDTALAECDTMRAERDIAKTERDWSRNERDGALRQREAMRVDRDSAASERDRLRIQRDAVLAERDAIREARDAAVNERDTALADRDGLRTERDGLAATLRHATHERDTTAEERDALRVENASVLPALDAACAERDHFAADRDRLRTERNQAHIAHEQAVTERDQLRAEIARLLAPRPVFSRFRNWWLSHEHYGRPLR